MTAPTDNQKKLVWPLFLVAGLSFVPVLGIFFGGAGATWGLISTRRNAMWAALLAMIGALGNIAAIMFLAGKGADAAGGMDAQFTRRELVKIVVALEEYHDQEHAYPPSLVVLRHRLVLKRMLSTLDMSARGFHFPHEYRYVVSPDGTSYDLVATGPDNVIGTADDIRPIVPDSIQAHAGFRPPVAGAHP